MKEIFYYKSRFFNLKIYLENGRIILIERIYDENIETEITTKSKEVQKIENEFNEYLGGKRKTFDIPIKLVGTEFQKKVWNELLNIPYGETRSYKDIAKAIGNEKASRAIGNANNKNPVMIIVPCHRVIGSDKKLVGYGGGLDMKEKLLELEENNK